MTMLVAAQTQAQHQTHTHASTVSERKRAANIANSRLSTGPRTPRGKSIVALNAVKHGLCSDARHIVLPGEDPAQFEATRAAWFAEFQPQTEVRAELVDRLVANSWKMKRCLREQTEQVAKAMTDAGQAFDAALQAKVNAAAGLMRSASWAKGILGLRETQAGLTWVISQLERLANLLKTPEKWTDDDYMLGLNRFLRRMPADAELSRIDMKDARLPDVKAMQIVNYNAKSTVYPVPAIRSAEELTQVAASLRAIIIQHMDYWLQDVERLPETQAERADAVVAGRLSAASSLEPLYRYEAQLNRSFRGDLRDLTMLLKTNVDLVEPPAPAEPEPEVEPTTEAVVVIITTETQAPQAIVAPAASALEAPAEAAPVRNKATEAQPNKAAEAAAPAQLPNKPTPETAKTVVNPAASVAAERNQPQRK